MFNLILLFLWIIFIIYWFVSARGNKLTEQHKKVLVGGMTARIILVLIIILLWILPIFSRALLSTNNPIRVIGLLFCLLGLAFAVWARNTLGTNWSANPIEIKKEHKLITVGPYQWVRHPIYAGVILALLGTFLANGRLRVFVLFILVATGMIIRSRMEDKLMMQKFPEKYSEYKKRVKSLIPKIF